MTSADNNNSVLTVCVTGAAGQISYSLLPLLASGRVFGVSQKIQLRLLEITPALGALSGVAMELHDGAYPLLDSVIETDDPEIAFSHADIAILVGAFPRKQGMERKDLLAKNISIFRAQGQALSKHASKQVKVVVVGNPANTNAMVLSKFAPNIPKENISALTRLDHNRCIGEIAKKLNVRVDQVDNVCIWGNHSSTQYPDVTHATVNGECVLKKLGNIESLAHDFIPKIQKRGAAIIKARGFSSAMSAANAIADHLTSWICGDDKIVSMAVPSDGSYDVPRGIFFSFPVHCPGDGTYQIMGDLAIDPFSMKYIKATTDELLAEREEAVALLD